MYKALLLLPSLMIFTSLSTPTYANSSLPIACHNFSHYLITDNNLQNTSIILEYQESGVRETVKSYLQSMHKDGVDAIRLHVPNIYNAENQNWGAISSSDPNLQEPERTNLANYFADIKNSGISTLIIAFAPSGANHPSSPNYNETFITGNFRFIKNIRSLAKAFGPPNIYFDLGNEMAPQNGIKTWENGDQVFQKFMNYINNIWQLYVNNFGYEDASFSSIVLSKDEAKSTEALGNLLEALVASGKHTPIWYPIHIYADNQQDVVRALEIADSTLTSHTLNNANLMITETYYNDRETMLGIKSFTDSHNRNVSLVCDWFLDKTSQTRVSPPYKSTAFFSIFNSESTTPSLPTLSEVITNFGSPYTIYDYNQLLTNYGT